MTTNFALIKLVIAIAKWLMALKQTNKQNTL